MFQKKRQGAVDVVWGDDALTGKSIEQAREVFERCLGEGQPKVVFDMQEVPLLDGAALEMLLDVREAYETRAGVLKLAAPNSLCKDVLDVTGVSQTFELYHDLKMAVGSFLQ